MSETSTHSRISEILPSGRPDGGITGMVGRELTFFPPAGSVAPLARGKGENIKEQVPEVLSPNISPNQRVRTKASCPNTFVLHKLGAVEP